jgi:hypothetical protein
MHVLRQDNTKIKDTAPTAATYYTYNIYIQNIFLKTNGINLFKDSFVLACLKNDIFVLVLSGIL